VIVDTAATPKGNKTEPSGDDMLWRMGLIVFWVSIAMAAINLVAGFVLGADKVKDIPAGVAIYLGIALVSVILLRAGGLLKATLPGGIVVEFAERFNRDISAFKALEIKVDALEKKIAECKPDQPETLEESRKRDAPLHLPPPTPGNDQQKGRFGGCSAKNGYRLGVNFRSAKDARMVDLQLVVERTDGLQLVEKVRFYLHQTFSPDEVLVLPKNGKATLDRLVVGGFTVGAWIDGDPETLLELDLSQIPSAPVIIRTL
jgi:hypothetical protein